MGFTVPILAQKSGKADMLTIFTNALETKSLKTGGALFKGKIHNYEI
jgi:hypothetical protein